MSFHNNRDSKGRFAPIENMQKYVLNKSHISDKYKTIRHKSENLVNHVAIILDRSSSMASIREDVVKQFNEQVRTLKKQERKTGQKTYITFRTFSTVIDSFKFLDANLSNLQEYKNSDYIPSGLTALFDAVGDTIDKFKDTVDYCSFNHSYLVIVITDGEENNSKLYNSDRLNKLIREVQGTDRWTFAFLVPDYGKQKLLNFGIPEGNIQIWEATHRGTQIATQSLVGSTQSYYTARSLGQTRSNNFFTPNLNISVDKLQRKLEDASKEFLRLNVNHDCRIDKYVEMATGNLYVVGSGYYQLTKSEKVQDYKGIVIREISTNKLFAGRNGEDLKEVRRMLKLPEVGNIKLHKGISPYYEIFIKSTSVNRKLINGTTLLLDKTLI